MKINTTTSFLPYAADLEPDLLLRHGMTNAYIDDHGYERPEDSKNEIDIFIQLKPDVFDEDFEDLCDALRSHYNFLDEYDVDSTVVFRLKLSDEWKHIKEELLTSKYSKIDRKYVKKYFPENTVQSYDKYMNPLYKKSMNYMILTKDPELRDKWEERLAVTITDDLELWERIHLEKEIFRHKKVEAAIDI